MIAKEKEFCACFGGCGNTKVCFDKRLFFLRIDFSKVPNIRIFSFRCFWENNVFFFLGKHLYKMAGLHWWRDFTSVFNVYYQLFF